MRRWVIALALTLLLAPACAGADGAEGEDASVYAMYAEDGAYLTSVGGRVYEGDEYIAGDDTLYRVIETDEETCWAKAIRVGEEPVFGGQEALSVSARAEEKDERRLVCLYATHSDESYVSGDGTESKSKGAGIYDVCGALKDALEEKGIEVVLSEQTHLPHDAKAYSRSRRTAEELLKRGPDALIDVHRDGIPDEGEYETEVEGEETSKVRLLVGRSNPNADANRAFAKKLKAEADKAYPGLVKDIFIGKGNYNQELYPQAILLEFGTHTIDKEKAISATSYMADVLESVLYGESAKAEGAGGEQKQEGKESANGIVWLVIAMAIAAGVYALIATGTFRGMWEKLARGASELTGGAVGRKPKK